MKTIMLIGVASRRSVLYWLLAELFLTCPDVEFIARMRRELLGTDASDSLAADLSALGAALPENSDASDTVELGVEYTRLFGAVSANYGLPPPYESSHRDAAAPGEVATTVSQFYSAAGLAPIDRAAPPDHLGVELRFLALLCHGEAEAWDRSCNTEALGMLRRQRDFLDQHLLQWVPAYLRMVQANTRHRFYRSLIALALDRITVDRGTIDRLLSGRDVPKRRAIRGRGEGK
jgi:TorA maturation chaperone TorD